MHRLEHRMHGLGCEHHLREHVQPRRDQEHQGGPVEEGLERIEPLGVRQRLLELLGSTEDDSQGGAPCRDTEHVPGSDGELEEHVVSREVEAVHDCEE
eukprot:CAMPEP_0180381568 /NCGR_PEP_ID=MMETSP0989-20121125/26808_1 /TAXON_ID=697907 /ORGANISM="non described non described, Strain CCMP2293" /LENGTH=97 /DNA_ID=CAMNT_0022381439 /DNA_START=313 /DNA_END=606 /DNA_ORIENTATION=-